MYENMPPESYGERPDLIQNSDHTFDDLRDIPAYSEHDNNLMALHEFEKLCWQAVELGHITATEAEEAIWSFIGHIEKPERLPGQIGSVAVQLTLEFE